MNIAYKTFMGDFETTVYEGQTETEVWASALVEMGTEDVKIFHSIDETFKYLCSLRGNIKVFYHNLRFDGSFWIDFLLNKLGYMQAFKTENGETDFVKRRDMKNRSFSYLISDMGQWYNIIIKVHRNCIITLQDSLKLLPFSVGAIGESFGTKHQKLEMEYEGYRYAGCEITEEEKRYIANDVFVVKEALEMLFAEGHTNSTIGGCCMTDFKKSFLDFREYQAFFPDLTKFELDKEKYGADNADAYIRKSYKGGWCYLVKGKENKIHKNGTTCDVNSLYPSVMHSESGSEYPTGSPTFWKGDYIPDTAKKQYYFIRIKTRFYLKKGMLPFVSIKGSKLYRAHDILETSDLKDWRTGEYYTHYYNSAGELTDTRVELTLTCTDWELLKLHYDLVDCEILDGCFFYTSTGIFDQYINKYRKIKIESTGAKRTLAKLFLNNLYGKFATSTISSFKKAVKDADGKISYITITQRKKKAGYIAIGSAITSYARRFTITAAQANFYGADKPGFIYSDTDSISCDIPASEIKGIKIHPKNFCCWKAETSWDEAFFVRAKTYIKHIVAKDEQPIQNPYFDIKCAGMPDVCKRQFLESMTGIRGKEYETYNDFQKEFVDTKREITDFKTGLKIYGKLMPQRIKGGTILVPTYFTMR